MTQKINVKIMFFLSLLLVFSACTKDEKITVEADNYKGVFIVNEGGFNKANGSIGLYKPGTNDYFDAYKKANNLPLGDVVQSMSLLNNNFYIVVNNSNKIEVVNQTSFKNTGTINLASPRHISKVDANKAYVSHLFSNELSVVDLNSNMVISKININHWSEHMSVVNKKVFVGTNSNKVMVVDVVKQSLVDSIVIGKGINKILALPNSKLLVFNTGDVDWNSGAVIEKGRLSFILADSIRIEKSIELVTGSYGGSVVYNNRTGKVYFSFGNNKLYEYTENATPVLWLELPTGQSVYGMSLDEANQQIYISDAGDFNAAGKVYVYDLSKKLIKTITAGIVPNGAVFNY